MMDNFKLILELARIVPLAERATPWKLIPWVYPKWEIIIIVITNIIFFISTT